MIMTIDYLNITFAGLGSGWTLGSFLTYCVFCFTKPKISNPIGYAISPILPPLDTYPNVNDDE